MIWQLEFRHAAGLGVESHLVPGWADRSKWQRAARLHSSRTAGRAAGASPLLSFLSRLHIHTNTPTALSLWHLVHAFSANSSEQTASKTTSCSSDRLVCQVVSENTPLPPAREAMSGPPPTGLTVRPLHPDKAQGRTWRVEAWKDFPRSCKESERSTADPTVRSSNRRRNALSASSLRPDVCCVPALWPPGGDKRGVSWFRNVSPAPFSAVGTFFSPWSIRKGIHGMHTQWAHVIYHCDRIHMLDQTRHCVFDFYLLCSHPTPDPYKLYKKMEDMTGRYCFKGNILVPNRGFR